MLMLWYCLITTFFFSETWTQNFFQEVGENNDMNHRTTELNNDDKIAKELDGEIPRIHSNDEIWFDTNDDEEKDYDILDVEEDVDDYLSYPSDDRNYENLMNYIKQEKSVGLISNKDNYKDSKEENFASEDFSVNEMGGRIHGLEGNDFDESERFKREINSDFPSDRGNLTYGGDDLQFRQGIDFDVYRRNVLQPNPYTSVYDFEHATPEQEIWENRWEISPCVTNLRELYTCIFCSGDPSIRQQFLSCYDLLPKRVKEQGIKCFSKVLKLPFEEESDEMNYFHYLCKKFKSIEMIIKCTSSSLPEEEERILAKYSYCLRGINSRHCC
ncbi:unnamed protein product [Larinioides sclopetarius]|uniref:Uncharacterized protein n=1 Tax=Larinioides sclopetarius TaxID=280406 RepID=A0AAV1ZEU2_9ARAC